MPRPRALIFWPVAAIAIIAALLGVRAAVTTAPLDRLAATERAPTDPAAARAGSLFIARGGPAVIGFMAPGRARLVIGTHEIVGTGMQSQWMIVPEGPIAIHFAGPASARLVWSPVGRRGDPEYIPASSLSADPPERAQFGASAGAAPLDGAIALAILLVIIASALMLARHRLAQVTRETWIAMVAVFALAAIVRWIDLNGHGETWDEAVYWASGRNYITNLLGLDASPNLWSWNYEHPPVMKYLAGIGAQFADGYGPARALSAVWVALGCMWLVPIGTRLFSRRTGILAAVIAALLPPLVAHGQIVGHEAVTVMWWPLGILLSLSLHDGEPDRRTLRIRLLGIGVVIGLAIASRFTNGLLGPLCLVIILRRARPEDRRTFLEGALGMPVVALVTLYAVWPRLWPHPLANLELAFEKLSQGHSLEPFLGTQTNHPGPHYFVVYLLATLPIAILAGVIAYLASRPKNRSAVILLAWFALPLGVMISPVRQDGVRYVLPALLALAMGSAAGLEWLAPKLRFPRAVIAAVVLYLGVTLVRVHPYYLDYFAEQVGGAGTVAEHGWFETAWWGEGVDRSVSYINANAPQGARVFRGCIAPVHVAWFRADLWVPLARKIDQADWIVTYAPQTAHCAIPSGFTRVFAVTASGATLSEVWRR